MRLALPAIGALPDFAVQRRRLPLILLVFMLHVGLVGLFLVARTPPVRQAAPTVLDVKWLDAPEPPQAPQRLQLPEPRLPSLSAPLVPVPVIPEVPVSVAQAPTAPPQREAAPAPSQPSPAAVSATPPAAASPKRVPPSAVRYLSLPRLNYPLLSRRAKEQGVVVLRILVDPDGRLADAAVHRSSGFARLDEQALIDIRSARFAPQTEDGRAVSWETLAPLAYELER